MTSEHRWLLVTNDPIGGEEFSLWSSEANAEAAKRRLMELWMRGYCADMEEPREPEAERPQFTDPLEDYLYDCKITFHIVRLKVDDFDDDRFIGFPQVYPDE